MLLDRQLDISIISNFIIKNFVPADIARVWNTCPNKMLWEAIREEDAKIISIEEVVLTLKQVSAIYVLEEPLPTFYQNTTLTYTLVSSSSFVAEFAEYDKIEPLYLISVDFSWMIVLTTENAPSGKRLCALMKNLHTE